MSGCGRQWCSKCAEELIHRDHRRGYESASALGQIIWREGPALLSVTDLDVAARKGMRDGSQLLRVIEQKQPGHKFERAQGQTLELIDACIVHTAQCDAADVRLHPRSGVYVIRGEIAAATSGRLQTTFRGPQQIEQLHTGMSRVINTHEELFEILDPENGPRRRRRAA